jgi:hypothetical protein
MNATPPRCNTIARGPRDALAPLPRESAEYGATASGMRLKGGRSYEEIWKWIHLIGSPCNPLKSHKTAKAFFGNAWRKQPSFGKACYKFWRSPLFRHLRRRSSNGEIGEFRLEDLA